MGFEIKTKNVHLKFGNIPVEKEIITSGQPKNTTVNVSKKDYTYAPLRTAILPTPAQLRQAVIDIDRDPRMMMDVLRRLPEADPHIFSVGNTRQLAILGYDWIIEPSDPDNEKEMKKCEEIMNLLERTNFDNFLTNLTNGIVYGHSVTNPIWTLDTKNRYYPKFDFLEGIHFGKRDGKVKMIVDKNDKDFFVTIGSNANITGINDQNQIASALAGNLYWVDLNENDLIIVNYVPPILQGWKNNYMGGLMRPGLYLTLLKYFTMLDWAKFNELFGMPVRVGKYDPVLTSKEGIEILKTAVQNIGTDAGAVIDKTMELEFLRAESGVGTGRATYEAFAEHVERKQSMVFIGQNLTAEQTGKYAVNRLRQARVHDAEGFAHRLADRGQPSRVIAQGDDEQDEEDRRHQQQSHIDSGDENERGDQSDERIGDEHQAGTEHQIEHAHVVGSASHDVADTLPAVERLALAQQADVQLIAAVAFHALGHELERRVAPQSG